MSTAWVGCSIPATPTPIPTAGLPGFSSLLFTADAPRPPWPVTSGTDPETGDGNPCGMDEMAEGIAPGMGSPENSGTVEVRPRDPADPIDSGILATALSSGVSREFGELTSVGSRPAPLSPPPLPPLAVAAAGVFTATPPGVAIVLFACWAGAATGVD